MMLEVRHFTDTAHILPDTEYLASKGCANLHGHTYAFIVRFEAEKYEMKGGMVVDFKLIKQLIDELDHKTLVHADSHPTLLKNLNDLNPKQVIDFPYIPSSENIASYILEKIEHMYPYLNHIEVWVCEGYKGSERANWTIAK